MFFRNRLFGDLHLGDRDLDNHGLPVPRSRHLSLPLSLEPLGTSVASLQDNTVACEGDDVRCEIPSGSRALRGVGGV